MKTEDESWAELVVGRSPDRSTGMTIGLPDPYIVIAAKRCVHFTAWFLS